MSAEEINYNVECMRNRTKIRESNGGLCEIVEELMENYLDGGKFLDDESYRCINFHIFECLRCKKEVMRHAIVVEEDQKIALKSVEDCYIEELKKAKNVCSIYKENSVKILMGVYGEKMYVSMINHCKKCEECKKDIHRSVKKIIKVNASSSLESCLDSCIDCKKFLENIDSYTKKMLSDRLSTMMQNHYLTCDTCNDIFINSLEDYKIYFNLNDRVC